MKARKTAFLMVVAIVFSTLLAGVEGEAVDTSPPLFGCQMLLTFPSAANWTKTNCDGWVTGLGITILNSRYGNLLGWVVFRPGLPTKSYDNFRMDNIFYVESCAGVPNGSPPPVGFYGGTMGIEGFDVLKDAKVHVRLRFALTRTGAAFLATLSGVTFAKGEDTKGNYPTTVNFAEVGAATGAFTPKQLTETLGVCGAPRQNHFDLLGTGMDIALS